MNNTIMGRLKTCSTESELIDLCTVIKMQLQQLHDDFYDNKIPYWRFRREQEILELCKHYANSMCDIFEIERI